MDPAELAEDFMVHVSLPPTGRRRQVAGGWLVYQPGPVPLFANVSGVRAADFTAVATLGQLASQWFGQLGRRDFVWFLGPSSRPAGIASYLQDQGVMRTSNWTAMFLSTEPSPVAGEIDVREVQSPRDLLVFRRLQIPAGGTDAINPAVADEIARTNDGAWNDLQAMNGLRRCYLAYLDGEPVAAGGLAMTRHDGAVLSGGATSAHARGKGCYRALVSARWTAAIDAGAHHLAVVASDDSRPILTRLGFQTAAPLTVLRQLIPGDSSLQER